MDLNKAIESLDKIIKKSRVHLYKPIQIAEILHRDRVNQDIDPMDLETYRTKSKKWRDIVCLRFLGRVSTSSAKYQDDVFSETAVPPLAIATLSQENRKTGGRIEAYIYTKFKERYSQMSSALNYTKKHGRGTFNLLEFLDLFWKEPGLRRSIDKIYEIIVYSLFSVVVDELNVEIEVSIDPSKIGLLREFEVFAEKVICITPDSLSNRTKASINRVGVTNAADRGLDMWANFGPAIQIKHLSLDENIAHEIVSTVTSDKIVIVCKDSDKFSIESLFGQLGWMSRIQSIVSESELVSWYEKALRGSFSESIGPKLIKSISDEIVLEFPSSDDTDFMEFFNTRGYDKFL